MTIFNKKGMWHMITAVSIDMLLDRESATQRVVLGGDGSSSNSSSKTQLTVCAANLALFCASWALLLWAFSANEPRSETSALALSYCGALNVLAVHWMPCVLSRITAAACALTLVQIAVEATASHAPTFVSISSLLVYALFVFLEWLVVSLQLPANSDYENDRSSRSDVTEEEDGIHIQQQKQQQQQNRFSQSTFSASDVLSAASRDESLAMFTQAGVELIYLLTALQHDDDCGLLVLHGASRSREYILIPLIWLFSAACASALRIVAIDMRHTTLHLPSVAVRNAMLITHRSKYWPIPIARALLDLLTAWRYSRILTAKTDQ